GIPPGVRAVPGVGARVPDDPRADRPTHLEAQAIPGRVAIREHGARLHLAQHGGVADDRMLEVLLPLEEIADGGEQARRAVRVEVRDAHAPLTVTTRL